MHAHLQTARLAIRRFTVADDDNLVRLNSDPEVMRYITGRPPGRDEIRDEIIPFHLAAYDRHPGFGRNGRARAGRGDALSFLAPGNTLVLAGTAA